MTRVFYALTCFERLNAFFFAFLALFGGHFDLNLKIFAPEKYCRVMREPSDDLVTWVG